MKLPRLLYAVALTCASTLYAQSVAPMLQPHQAFVNASGIPCAGCALYSYAAGTTTLLATYADATGVTQNANPIILDVAGGAVIWLGNSAYKFVLKDTLGTTIWTVDNVTGISVNHDASQLSTGTLPHGRLPALLSADIPNNAANTSGTAANLSGNPDLSVNSLQVKGATVIPSTVTGYLGSGGTGVLLGSGTFTVGHCLQVGTNGGAADAGFACGSGGGGGGLSYTSPTLYAIPAVSNAAGSGAVINSALSDDGNNTYDTEPFLLSADYTIQPTATATVSNNYNSHSDNSCASLWNGTTATPECLQHYLWIGTGTNPAVLDDHYFPAGLTTDTVFYGVNQATAATNSQNYNTPKFKLRGACWNGTSSTTSDWDWIGNANAGTNAGNILTFTYTGCGSGVVSMPALTLGGTPYIASGISTNTDVSGELTFSGATTASYSFANTYLVRPECWATPQFDPGSGVRMWVTYTSTTSMTINFSTSVTGTVSYGCVGRS